MPNRILREGILSSMAVCSLNNWAVEVFYRRLFSIVDDYGRHEYQPMLIRSKCYPLQTDKVRVSDISLWMATCQKAGLIIEYESSGKRYFQIEKFGQQTRTPSKCPAPPIDSTCAQMISNVSPVVVVGAREVGGAVEGARPPPAPPFRPPKSTSVLPPGFLRFWDAYPNTARRTNRAGCAVTWERHGFEEMADLIVAHVEACARSDEWRRGFEPMTKVYLNQRRWESPPPPEKGNENGNSTKQHLGVSFDADKSLAL